MGGLYPVCWFWVWFCGVDVIFGYFWTIHLGFGTSKSWFRYSILGVGIIHFPWNQVWEVARSGQSNSKTKQYNSLGWSKSDPELNCHNGDIVRIQKLAKQGMRLHMFHLHSYTTQVRRFRNQGINGTAGGNRHGPYILDHPVQNDRVRNCFVFFGFPQLQRIPGRAGNLIPSSSQDSIKLATRPRGTLRKSLAAASAHEAAWPKLSHLFWRWKNI